MLLPNAAFGSAASGDPAIDARSFNFFKGPAQQYCPSSHPKRCLCLPAKHVDGSGHHIIDRMGVSRH